MCHVCRNLCLGPSRGRMKNVSSGAEQEEFEDGKKSKKCDKRWDTEKKFDTNHRHHQVKRKGF